MDLSTLKTQRDAASARVASLQAGLAKIERLKAETADAAAALRSHDAGQAERLKAWAVEGAEGDVPGLDHKGRKALADDLAKAEGTLAAATGAYGVISTEFGEARGALLTLTSEVQKIALEQVLGEHADAVADLDRAILAEVQPRLKRVLSLHSYLIDEAAKLRTAGDDRAQLFYVHAERLSEGLQRFLSPMEPPLQGVVDADADHWRTRTAEIAA